MDQNTNVGRNEPCPCGSGKKYKRCCGVGAAPKLGVSKLEGMSPEEVQKQLGGVDPQMLSQASQMFNRLPKDQIQRLQSLMQKAMSGKDISCEAEDFENTLPQEFQTFIHSTMRSIQPNLEAQAAAVSENPEMSVDQARTLVQEALAEGKISQAEANVVLGSSSSKGAAPVAEKGSSFSRFWKGLKGEK